ncbi:MAG: isoaspartyl peptidase/L-asparaginase [Cyclobacteriaceae bacterium]|nr:isoaspartyl peptidase/L-asparaginase [Cyclobacteriaceae bacterium]
MKRIFRVTSTSLYLYFVAVVFTHAQPVALVIHDGAGNIEKQYFPDTIAQQYRQKLEEALLAGYDILQRGGTSMDAIHAAIVLMEDSPLFNAGKGAVFTHAGTNEMDAALMDGATLKAGAVAGVKHIKNPISAARAVMDHSPHVMLTGKGAEEFAQQRGILLVDSSYFYTEKSYRHWKKANMDGRREEGIYLGRNNQYKFGTVGAVALDIHGNIAAGTSTGGMTNKRYGRVGDSPIIGAGTYANNSTCGISATGHGEYFIRSVVAYDISALMEYKGLDIQSAADRVIKQKLKERGGEGGVIGLDKQGNVMFSFNTKGMFRAYIKEDQIPRVFIYE